MKRKLLVLISMLLIMLTSGISALADVPKLLPAFTVSASPVELEVRPDCFSIQLGDNKPTYMMLAAEEAQHEQQVEEPAGQQTETNQNEQDAPHNNMPMYIIAGISVCGLIGVWLFCKVKGRNR